MDDEPTGGERSLTPAEEEQVRRALATWRPGPDAMPPEVAARLSATIGELAAERAGAEAPAPGPAAHRRRWPTVLVAAAAVSVVALGVGNLVQGTGGGGDAMSAADAGAPAESAQRADKPAPSAPEASSYAAAPLPRLHSGSLRRDVARLAGTAATATNRLQDTRDLSGAAAGCALPVHDRGHRLFLARLDGQLVSVVLDRARAGSRETRVYSCDDPAAPLATFAVPVG